MIMGMDWLSQYHVVLDCYSKKVTFQNFGGLFVSFYGDRWFSKIQPMKEIEIKWLRMDGG